MVDHTTHSSMTGYMPEVLCVAITGEQVKIFKKGIDDEPNVALDNTDTEGQSDKDHENEESEESGLKLIIDI